MLGGFLSLMLIQFTFAEQGTVLCSKRMYKLRQWIYFVATYAAVQRKSGSDDPLFALLHVAVQGTVLVLFPKKKMAGNILPAYGGPRA